METFIVLAFRFALAWIAISVVGTIGVCTLIASNWPKRGAR